MRFMHCTAARRRTLTGTCNYTNLLANLQLSTCVLRVRFIVPLYRFNTYLYDNWVGWETETSADCKKKIHRVQCIANDLCTFPSSQLLAD